MSIRVTASLSPVLGRAALVGLIATTAAGCIDSQRLATPLFAGSKDQRDIVGNSQPMPPPVTNAAVTRNNLPPPTTTGVLVVSPQTDANLPPGAYEWTPDGIKPSSTPSTVPAAADTVPRSLTAPTESRYQFTKSEPRVSVPPIEPPSADGRSFRWPVRGRIISGFGATPSGQRNDGINIAVPEGTSVEAAEAGIVIYAGDEVGGYGNLVLIRHADDWVSAYAHNSEIKVKKGDTIRRGQTIATAGMSGSVTSPQLHFELRNKAEPVNPLDYLADA